MNPSEAIRLLRERERAATPGPWFGDWVIVTGDGDPVARTDVSLASDPAEHDACGPLIAAARNALPALLDVAEAAQAIADIHETWDARGDLRLENAHDRLAAALDALAKAVGGTK